MSGLFQKVERLMIDAFTKAGTMDNISHHQLTVHWIKELKPGASEALLIAGMLHDIERAFNGDWKAGSDDPEKLRKHQDLSAEAAEKFLLEAGAEQPLITEVKRLIQSHEEGGDEDQSVLCDADCVAYFEEKALKNAKKFKARGRSEEFKKKLDYYFSRISSQEGQQLVRTFYDEAMNELDAI